MYSPLCWTRLAVQRLPPPDARSCLYANDVGVRCRSLRRTLPTLGVVTQVLERASALKLKPEKCVAVPLRTADAEAARSVVARAPALAGARIVGRAVYLGIAVGPDSAPDVWSSALTKYCDRVSEACGGRWSRLRARALQRIWKVPFNSIIPPAALARVVQ